MSRDNVVGVFIGLESSSNEYVAHLIAPYKSDFAIEIGTLLLVQNANAGIVARVMDYIPRGEFISAMGEKWLNDMASEGAIDAIGHDIKRSKVSYKVKIKILGSMENGKFSPGLRRIPQITSRVTLPSDAEFAEIIKFAMAEQSSGVHIGTHALKASVSIAFDQSELNEKRTFIFARAGYGKSNLMKLICKEWKSENGGLLVFDQDGEYAVTDRKGRPGVMDGRPAILVTNQRMNPSLRNVYQRLRLDLGRLPHKLVIPLLVNPSKHDTVFFAKLMAMDRERWPNLVELLKNDGWGADYNEVERIVLNRAHGSDSEGTASEVDVKPIVNNLARPIRDLHDRGSQLMPIVERAMRDGHVLILDISRIDSASASMISSIIVKKIFAENQDNFIKHGGNRLIRATFVLEEAHNVLQSQRGSTPSAFVDLAKEGRKYNLGGIFITQQPGAIPTEIVSQGDNFFVFHLLSKTDLQALSKANAHYSNDIITQILSEPIRGKCYMWTSHQPFVMPVMVANFEENTVPNSSAGIQEGEMLLEKITDDMISEADNPVLKSIYSKFAKVEGARPQLKEGDKTIQLFKSLTEEERDYLRERNCLQDAGSGEFAVTFPCYRRLGSKELV